MNKIPEIFHNPVIDLKRLSALQAQQDPKSRYMIAMTPRSGSTYLCDLMSQINRFGQPNELIHQDGVPQLMKDAPGRNPDEYIRNVMRDRQTENGVSGLKASWFQFENFMNSMEEPGYLSGFKYIYLTRRNLAAQAVSLYKATSTGLFHAVKGDGFLDFSALHKATSTDVLNADTQHDRSVLEKFEALEYDYERIKYWYEHIVAQEKGWQQYFYENRIYPLCISYEDIEENVLKVMQRIAVYIGDEPNMVYMPIEQSIFKKISDHRNGQWMRRFSIELSLSGLG